MIFLLGALCCLQLIRMHLLRVDMNLILNRDFKMPDDGWYQLAPLGEFAHAVAGVIQVVDTEACVAMVARFNADAAVPNFAGLLVDFDHFSLDAQARSEAAGWIVDLASRDTGLWANIRWSDVGEEAVKGGRYRFLSPVWARSDCVDLGNGRVRPVRLLNAAVTNDPNLKGLVPLANASPVDRRVSIERVDFGQGKDGLTMKRVIETLTNHLGIPGDASEDLILEKMQGLPAVTAVAELQNSLKQAKDECDALRTELKGAEDEIVNRHLAEFEGVVTEKTKTFWTEQLMANRVGALAALSDLVEVAQGAKGKEPGKEPTPGPSKEGSRKPLHNRAAARPVIPGVGGSDGQTESQAVKIRNRAHEIVKSEKVPFSVAFRRAEREVLGNG
jgi:phage I-like protein